MKIPFLPSLWLGRLCLHIGITHRGDNGVTPPWCGFYYGSWWPRMRVSRRAGYNAQISGYWLCFHWGVDWWSKGTNNWGLR